MERYEAVAPNISKAYDDALVMAVLKMVKGSIGSMPSFSGRLNETQRKSF